MSDNFDFSLDVISKSREPESVQECKFDEIIPWRLKNGDTVYESDIQLINEKIREESDALARTYFDNVTYKEVNCEYLSDVKSYINSRDFDDDFVENSYKTSIIESGYTAENIDEYISKAKDDLERGREYFESEEQGFYARIYDTEHSDKLHGIPIERVLSDETVNGLGESYAEYCKSREVDSKVEPSVDKYDERVRKANNLISNITKEDHNIQKE